MAKTDSVAAVGFRVKSGWAAAVLLVGSRAAPQVVDRRVVALSDDQHPATRQPYHAGFGTLETNAARIERRTAIIRRAAERSVRSLLADCRAAGHVVRGAGLVVGSLIDPATVGNTHIRAHASEGRLFRTVLLEALQEAGVAGTVLVEKEAYARAAHLLGRNEAELKQAVAALRRPAAGPWRAEDKLAALAAWTVL